VQALSLFLLGVKYVYIIYARTQLTDTAGKDK